MTINTIHRSGLASLLALAATMTACGDPDTPLPDDGEQTFVLPDPEGNWILVDQIHTSKQNLDLKLERDNYAYQGMHGYHRLFKHLEARGYPYSQLSYTQSDERLTRAVLDGFKVLFINLVSSDRPDFTAAEIADVTEWVRAGGGLFIIADHTNVYYHAQRINPILEPMGIKVTFHTALDRAPEFSIAGGAWLKIKNWDRAHPISEGIKIASFQTGGPFETDHGVAFLSPDGFGDFWQENPNDPGFYGNWSRDPGEPQGPLPVVAAAPFGPGRVAVVGDQNIFGDEWLLVAHNLELALNTFEWLADNENTPTPLRDTTLDDTFTVGLPLEQSDWNIGINFCAGYFPFFINFNRQPRITARGILDFDKDYDALVFTDPSHTFSAGDLDRIKAHLDADKPLVILTDLTRARQGSVQLIQELVPEFSVDGLQGPLTAANLPASADHIETVLSETEFPILSDTLDLAGLRMSGHTYPTGVACPEGVADAIPTMRRVRATFGTPFLQAELPDGTLTDVARRTQRPQGGQIIVFLQDGFWRNETLGAERQMPTPDTQGAHHIEYRFHDWLITQGPGALE